MKAIVIGATGLVGREILKRLLEDPEFAEVRVFHRRSTGITHSKLTERIIDFEQISEWQKDMQGDVLFSALGTTLKTAGSKEQQYKVDYSYQFKVAAAARENGVSTMVLISSTGADAHSPFFYLKMKGELERALVDLGFERLRVLRSGPLKGHREVPRISEAISTTLLGFFPKKKTFASLLPVPAERVARAAVEASKSFDQGLKLLEPADIYFLGQN